MSDLTGSTVLKDDEFETVISTPKRPAVNLNTATRDQYPEGMTDEEILAQMGAAPQTEMATDQVESPAREPQQVAKNVTPDMMNKSLQGFQQAVKPVAPVAAPVARPVAPPQSMIPQLKSEVTIPERPSPYAAKSKAEKALGRGYDESLAHGYQAKEAALEAAREQQSSIDQAAEVINQKGGYIHDKLGSLYDEKARIQEANLKADQLQSKINEDISKKISEDPGFYQRTLGDRVMWAISTFVAGLGGKGESVLNMLKSDIEMKAKADAQKVMAMAKMYKPIKSAVDTRNIDKEISIWEKERVNFYDTVALKLIQQGKAKAKTPEELARWERFQAALTEKR